MSDVEKKPNWFMRHKILTGIIVLIVIGMVSSSGNKGGSNNATSNGSATAKTQESKAQVYGLNQEVVDKDLSFTITNVTKQKNVGNSYTKKTAQGMFYIVTVQIKNNGDKTTTFDSSMAVMTDSQNRQFERSIEGQTALGMEKGSVDLFLQQVQPGLSVTGKIIFDVPEDIADPMVVVKGSIFSSGQKIKLQ